MDHTHFASVATGRVIFELGQCSHCAGPVQEANAVGTASDREELLRLGLEPYPVLPPEVIVSDETGDCACSGCEFSPVLKAWKEITKDASFCGLTLTVNNPSDHDSNGTLSATPGGRAIFIGPKRDIHLVLLGVTLASPAD